DLQTIATGVDARGDEIAIETGCTGVSDQLVQIAPHHRLAAGKVDLQDSKGCRLLDDALPIRGRELVACGVKLQGIGAVRALQGAAMRQLREHGPWGVEPRVEGRIEGWIDGLGAQWRRIPLSASSATSWHTSWAMSSRLAS